MGTSQPGSGWVYGIPRANLLPCKGFVAPEPSQPFVLLHLLGAIPPKALNQRLLEAGEYSRALFGCSPIKPQQQSLELCLERPYPTILGKIFL